MGGARCLLVLCKDNPKKLSPLFPQNRSSLAHCTGAQRCRGETGRLDLLTVVEVPLTGAAVCQTRPWYLLCGCSYTPGVGGWGDKERAHFRGRWVKEGEGVLCAETIPR